MEVFFAYYIMQIMSYLTWHRPYTAIKLVEVSAILYPVYPSLVNPGIKNCCLGQKSVYVTTFELYF